MKSGAGSGRPADETRMVERIVSGDREALGDAFREHSQLVFRVAYGITREVSAAEEVVQEVFVSLPEWLRTFEARSTLATWLYRVTLRTASHHVRAERRWTEVLFAASPFLKSKSHQPPITNRVAIERALAQMPPSHREVLWLKTVEGWSHPEIAEMLGIDVRTSYQRLHRARVMMQRLLRGEG